jgi:hypothetical protein
MIRYSTSTTRVATAFAFPIGGATPFAVRVCALATRAFGAAAAIAVVVVVVVVGPSVLIKIGVQPPTASCCRAQSLALYKLVNV